MKKGEPIVSYAILQDITGAVEAKESESSLKEQYRLLMESSDIISFDYILAADKLHISFMGDHGVRTEKDYLEYSKIFSSSLTHVDSHYKKRLLLALNKVKKEPKSTESDFKCIGPDGLPHFYHAKMMSLGSGMVVNRIIGCLDNVDRLMKEQERKLAETRIDRVSGLKTKDAAKEEISLLLRERPFDVTDYMIFFDIDNFKLINDTIGHLEADKILAKIGDILLDSFRDSDVLSRFGGDEFLIYMVNPHSERSVLLKTKKIMRLINEIETPLGSVHCSLGIVSIQNKLRSFSTAFKRVDRTMYLSKNKGKNCFSIYSSPK